MSWLVNCWDSKYESCSHGKQHDLCTTHLYCIIATASCSHNTLHAILDTNWLSIFGHNFRVIYGHHFRFLIANNEKWTLLVIYKIDIKKVAIFVAVVCKYIQIEKQCSQHLAPLLVLEWLSVIWQLFNPDEPYPSRYTLCSSPLTSVRMLQHQLHSNLLLYTNHTVIRR